MPQEHERGLGGWQAEWEAIPEIFGLVAGSARAMRETCDGLEIDAPRMRENLDRDGGLAMAEAVMVALAEKVGRPEARTLVEAAVRRARTEGRSFGAVLRDDPAIAPRIDPRDLDRILDPEQHLGNAAELVSRVLATRGSR
jgi:3-carboxy-cis,cis-muconate cycloisomerase